MAIRYARSCLGVLIICSCIVSYLSPLILLEGNNHRILWHFNRYLGQEDKRPVNAYSNKKFVNGCLVQFKEESTLLCSSTFNSSKKSISILRMLLHHFFQTCSSSFLRTKDLSIFPELRFQRRCLFVFEDNLSMIRPGDIYWGYNPKQLDQNDVELFLAPDGILQTASKGNISDSIKIEGIVYSLSEKLINSFPLELFHIVRHENSTAVIMLGDLRGGEDTWSTLYKYVLDINNADLILVTIGEVPASKNSSSLLRRAKYTFQIPQFADWSEVMDIIALGNKTWRSIVPRVIGTSSILLGVSSIGSLKGSGALIFSARWILRKIIQENRFHLIYDRFVLTRSDQFYLCNHNLSNLLPVSKIFIPKGEDYRGICDRHLICSSDDVNAVLDLLPPLIKNPERYAKYSQSNFANTESFLKLRLKETRLIRKVERFPRTMFVAAVSGDNFTWKPPVTKKNLSERVSFKYEREYLAAKAECFAMIKDIGDQQLTTLNSPPMGFGLWNGSVITGWACDKDNPLASLTVRICVSHYQGTNYSEIYRLNVPASLKSNRKIRERCYGGLRHRFSLVIPSHALRTNNPRIQAFAIDPMDPSVEVEIFNITIQ
jgi:hypothetical protein